MKIMDEIPEKEKTDLRHALAWIIESNARTVIVVALFLLAGLASYFGYLRWQGMMMRGSFSLICLAIIAIILVSKFQKREKPPA